MARKSYSVGSIKTRVNKDGSRTQYTKKTDGSWKKSGKSWNTGAKIRRVK